jgi:hypothetical protein
MLMKNTQELMIGILVVTALLIVAVTSSPRAFADNVCIGFLACGASGGSGGRGGDTGDATGGDIGPGGSCFANDHSTIGDECGGSTGSSEPRSGSGDHSMNGGRGGEATVNLND